MYRGDAPGRKGGRGQFTTDMEKASARANIASEISYVDIPIANRRVWSQFKPGAGGVDEWTTHQPAGPLHKPATAGASSPRKEAPKPAAAQGKPADSRRVDAPQPQSRPPAASPEKERPWALQLFRDAAHAGNAIRLSRTMQMRPPAEHISTPNPAMPKEKRPRGRIRQAAEDVVARVDTCWQTRRKKLVAPEPPAFTPTPIWTRPPVDMKVNTPEPPKPAPQQPAKVRNPPQPTAAPAPQQAARPEPPKPAPARAPTPSPAPAMKAPTRTYHGPRVGGGRPGPARAGPRRRR